jgi:hypothetical protein
MCLVEVSSLIIVAWQVTRPSLFVSGAASLGVNAFSQRCRSEMVASEATVALPTGLTVHQGGWTTLFVSARPLVASYKTIDHAFFCFQLLSDS